MHRTAAFAVAVAVASFAGCSVPADTFIRPTAQGGCLASDAAPSSLRFVTYNIKAGQESSIDVIGDVLADLRPDVVALQEVDRDADRSAHRDQARDLADRLGMQPAYAATKKLAGGGDFGVAILSRLPYALVERFDLPSEGSFEPRVALAADVCVGERSVRVFSHHSDLQPLARQAQHEALVDLARPHVGKGVVLGGDLNDTVQASSIRALVDVPLNDVGAAIDDMPTCDGRRIDFVLADDALAGDAPDIEVIETDASDHYPVLATLTP